MSKSKRMNRRDLIVKTATAAGAASALAGVRAAAADASRPLPVGFQNQAPPVAANWNSALGDLTKVNFNTDASELEREEVKERHRIYCYLLMKLIVRFWNGNKFGPFGTYRHRDGQQEVRELNGQRYRGDSIAKPEGTRINWDRYLGHNIACIAVDGNGAIVDFDFNHNDFFRSTVEHAESRLVRRLFSLTDGFDSWRTGQRVGDHSRAFSLNEITLYTSLESCAQCSGIMSLAGVKQIIYLQNDFTAYMIGNIMYNLANRTQIAVNGVEKNFQGAPVPIPGSEVGLDELDILNNKNIEFCNEQTDAAQKNDASRAFFISTAGTANFSPSITSFLCTDEALEIFTKGAAKLDALVPRFPDFRFPDAGQASDKVLKNSECIAEAQRFYSYADIDGYRGSPHKL